MRRVLLLDIDGVLNTFTDTLDADDFHEDKVELLNQIIDATKAEVIISSDWQVHHSVDEFQGELELAGFRHKVSGVTGHAIHSPRRLTRIERWLDENEVDAIVILDDRDLHKEASGDAQRKLLDTIFVRTDPDVGLTQELAVRAIELMLAQ